MSKNIKNAANKSVDNKDVENKDVDGTQDKDLDNTQILADIEAAEDLETLELIESEDETVLEAKKARQEVLEKAIEEAKNDTENNDEDENDEDDSEDDSDDETEEEEVVFETVRAKLLCNCKYWKVGDIVDMREDVFAAFGEWYVEESEDEITRGKGVELKADKKTLVKEKEELSNDDIRKQRKQEMKDANAAQEKEAAKKAKK